LQDYYNSNAQKFFSNTYALDMSEHHERFLQHLPPNAKILDAGCGSGRDAKKFNELGYEVDAFDASEELVKLARKSTNLPIKKMSFSDLQLTEAYDGIWCCASLLHVPIIELPEDMRKLATALKRNGVWYVSFKYGTGQREKDGRVFSDLDETGITDIVEQLPEIEIQEIWISHDIRKERNEKWLNAILTKKG
jgi:SAM-dependent methyltransferase